MDALVVGCGLSGAVVARYLAETLNMKVLILERRNHIGGNMYDFVDQYGVLVHKYGPHTFHTNKKELYEYMSRFCEWNSFKLTCGAIMNGKFTPTPFNFSTIDTFYNADDAEELKNRIQEVFPNCEKITVLEALKCNDDKIRNYAQWLFDNDYSLYTAKQWGCSAKEIDPSILQRVPLRFSYETGYFDKSEIQVMPQPSYTEFFKRVLDHPNIDVQLNIDALQYLKIDCNQIKFNDEICNVPIVYTGAIDQLFGFSEGRLPYRSLRFEWMHEDIESKLDAPVVAFPQVPDFTRITEYKKLPLQNVNGTSYAIEYSIPCMSDSDNEPYYPVLTQESQRMYLRYLGKADEINNLYLTGRLADFKYYNMDEALEKALITCKEVERNFMRHN